MEHFDSNWMDFFKESPPRKHVCFRAKMSYGLVEGRSALHVVHRDVRSSATGNSLTYRLSMATLLVFVSRFVAKVCQN
jgi:hypothetical protein